MKRLLLLLVFPCFVIAQEKIGNKIYKYGEVYHSIEGSSLISFDEAKAKTMSKTLEYFSDAGAKSIKSYTSIFLPGTEVSEDTFASTLDKNNIQTLIVVDIIDASEASMSRTTASAFSSVNQKRENSMSSTNRRWSSKAKGNSTSSSSSTSSTKNVNFITELNLRLTIFSKNDNFSTPVAVVEGRATNESPETTSDQMARRIVRRMVKALGKQRAF
jgi:transglutaminase/protease-like cytokinesis protein 3